MKDKALKKVKAKCKQLCKEQGGSNKYSKAPAKNMSYGKTNSVKLKDSGY